MQKKKSPLSVVTSSQCVLQVLCNLHTSRILEKLQPKTDTFNFCSPEDQRSCRKLIIIWSKDSFKGFYLN